MPRFSHIYTRFVDGLHRGWPRLYRAGRFVWAVIVRAVVKYDETDGEQRAASFAYYAFFALFPLVVLVITLSTMFFRNQDFATEAVTGQLKLHLPVDPALSDAVIRTIQGVVKSRGQASLIA